MAGFRFRLAFTASMQAIYIFRPYSPTKLPEKLGLQVLETGFTCVDTAQ
jgi:hypothetical protein